MRKKMHNDEKKVSFGLSLDPELSRIIKEYTQENNLKVSQFIESILKEKLMPNKNIKIED